MPSNNEEGPSLNQIQRVLDADGSTEVRIKPFPNPIDKGSFFSDAESINEKIYSGSFEEYPRKTPETPEPQSQSQSKEELINRNKEFIEFLKKQTNIEFKLDTINICSRALNDYCSNPVEEKLLKDSYQGNICSLTQKRKTNKKLDDYLKKLENDTEAMRNAGVIHEFMKAEKMPLGLLILSKINRQTRASKKRNRGV